MSAHHVVPAHPERRFHSRTGVAEAAPLKNDLAYPKTPISQRDEVDARHHEVAPQPFGKLGGVLEASERRDHA